MRDHRRHLRLAGVSPASADDWRKNVTLTLSDRVRVESVDWFDPRPGQYPAGAGPLAFLANQLRFGAKLKFPAATVVVEGQDVRLWDVPDDATRATAPGNLGPGANYYQYTPETDQGATVLRQAYVTAQSGGFGGHARALRVGRGRRDAAQGRRPPVAQAHAHHRAPGRPVRLHARGAHARRGTAVVRPADVERDRRGRAADRRRVRGRGGGGTRGGRAARPQREHEEDAVGRPGRRARVLVPLRGRAGRGRAPGARRQSPAPARARPTAR